MFASPGIGLVLAANAVLLVAAAAALVYVYRRTGPSESRDREQWYAEVASLAAEVEGTAAVDPPVDRDRIQREILPLSTRLKSLARSAPSDVDDQFAGDLHQLGVDCYRVGMEHTMDQAVRTDVFLEDELEQLREAAARLKRDAARRP